jgi:DNA-binding CsgD family transcriptional regulator
MELRANGYSSTDASYLMGVQPSTVNSLIRRVQKRFGADSSYQALAMAVALGLVEVKLPTLSEVAA